jgi:hypothetical protein
MFFLRESRLWYEKSTHRKEMELLISTSGEVRKKATCLSTA